MAMIVEYDGAVPSIEACRRKHGEDAIWDETDNLCLYVVHDFTDDENFEAVLAKNFLARQVKKGGVGHPDFVMARLREIEKVTGLLNQPGVDDILASEHWW